MQCCRQWLPLIEHVRADQIGRLVSGLRVKVLAGDIFELRAIIGGDRFFEHRAGRVAELQLVKTSPFAWQPGNQLQRLILQAGFHCLIDEVVCRAVGRRFPVSVLPLAEDPPLQDLERVVVITPVA